MYWTAARSSSRAAAVRGSLTLPSMSTKNRYSHGRPGRGRDSSFVSECPLPARICRQRSSAPSSCRVTMIRLVLQAIRASTGVAASDNTTNRV